MEESLVCVVCVCCVRALGRGVENEEGREGILVRIDVEGSGEKNAKNEIENFINFALWSFNYCFSYISTVLFNGNPTILSLINLCNYRNYIVNNVDFF